MQPHNNLQTGLELIFMLPLIGLFLLGAIFVALLFIEHRLARIQRGIATMAKNSAMKAAGPAGYLLDELEEAKR